MRQGDPLSPLLFVLSMEYLSRILKKASTVANFRFHPNCRKMGLTHLLFADDLLVFCAGDPTTIHQIIFALEKFHKIAGLSLNRQKSQIILGGCSQEVQDECLRLTNFPQGTLPLKYLGVPITDSRFTKLDCRQLLNKMLAQIQKWAAHAITYSGRVTLLNSVVFGMINYWAAIFILPKEVLIRIEQLCRNYLWSGAVDYKKIPYVSWEKICQPKKKGGLGLKNIHAWNQARLAKLIWAVAFKKDLLWVRWVHGRHLKVRDWWSYSPPPRTAVGTGESCVS